MLLGDTSWKYVKTKSGIKVYQRKVTKSKFDEFSGTGIINADIESINKIITKPKFFYTWMPKCIQSIEIKPIGTGTTFTYYVESKSPWPMANRDMIVVVNVVKKPKTIIHYAKALVKDSLKPKRKKIVRVIDMEAQWVLRSRGKKSLVTYTLRTNPGGNIPIGLMNAVGADLPIDNIIGVRKRLKALKK